MENENILVSHASDLEKATFYRNITIFEEENLINSFESNDKKRYFEIKDIATDEAL